jgi:hypothetical protein
MRAEFGQERLFICAGKTVTTLWHVSDQHDIARFQPRLPGNRDAGVTEPVVWAVDDAHLTNYLLPRDCPRICLRVAAGTTQEDRIRFFAPSTASAVILIEEAWYERALGTPLWIYELPPAQFTLIDGNAGYYVSLEAADPIGVTEVRQPLQLMKERGTELRSVTRLRQLAHQVARSTVAFSIIRLRNAAEDTEIGVYRQGDGRG